MGVPGVFAAAGGALLALVAGPLLIRSAAFSVTAASPQDAAPPPFVVGVWGQGDAVIPFADFDGQRWRRSWPRPTGTKPASRPLERIPATWWGRATFQPTWELIDSNGRRQSIQVTGTAPAGLGSECSSNLGLKTNTPHTYQYGTALAASRSGVIDPVATLESSSIDWQTVRALLPDIYHRYEGSMWKEISEDFRPDLSAPLSGPRLDAAFMFQDDLGEYAYFESSREFARRRDQSGDGRSFITGWLWRRSSTVAFQLVTVEPGTIDADGKGSNSFRPLGVVRHGSRRFWLGSLSSYAYSGPTVLDVRRAGVSRLLLVDYPGC